tara:strand:- start:1253 stop:1354 length:102 start_codon:yes stop_codon:yes gene_type:complete
MWWLLLEIALALGIVFFIIWWTMFSGNKENDED